MECPCTNSANIHRKCISSSRSVFSLPLSILQTRKEDNMDSNPNTLLRKHNIHSPLKRDLVTWTLVTQCKLLCPRACRSSKERAGETWNIWMQARRHSSAVTQLHSPLGPYLQQTFTPWSQRFWDDYCYACLRCLLSLMKDRKKKTHPEKFRCAVRVRSQAIVSVLFSFQFQNESRECTLFLPLFSLILSREKKNLSTQCCSAVLIPKDPALVMS